MIDLENGMIYVCSYMRGNLLRDEIKIPTFQRPYVWQMSDVHLFVDSLLRSYPIGNLVFMQLYNGESIASKEMPWSLKEGGSKYPVYLLDGQQRLMTCIKLFITGEFEVMLPKTATSKFEFFVCRKEDRDLEQNFCITQICRDFRGKHPELISRMAITDPYCRTTDFDDFPYYAMGLTGTQGNTELAISMSEMLRNVDLPYYNLKVEGKSTLHEAVSVFKRLNMAGVPVDIEYLESL